MRTLSERICDPRHWRLRSPLLSCWVVMVALAAVAAAWCVRQPLAIGLPCLLVVLFAEGLAALVLFAATARGLAAEVRVDLVSRLDRLTEALGVADAKLQAVASWAGSGGETGPADRRAVRESAESVRAEMAAARQGLAESISRARHEVEDVQAMLVELFRGPGALSAWGTTFAGDRSDAV